MICRIFAVVAFVASIALFAQNANAQIGQGNYPNHLFSQYTTQGNGGATAGQYPAPHPVPSHVGHQYTTYEPLMPHEMMYTHQRNYYNYYNDNSFYGGGPSLNVTSVRWQNGCSGFRPMPFSNHYLSKLQYGLSKRAYCMDGDCGGSGGGVLGRIKEKCANGDCDEYVDGGY